MITQQSSVSLDESWSRRIKLQQKEFVINLNKYLNQRGREKEMCLNSTDSLDRWMNPYERKTVGQKNSAEQYRKTVSFHR